MKAAGANLTQETAPGSTIWLEWERLSKCLFEFWNRPVLESTAVRVGLIAAVVTLSLIRASIGLSGIEVYSHDAFGVLDGAWRVLHGQRPHVDFYTPLGPVIYWLTAFGLWLAHGGAEGFGYSQAVAGLLLGLWTYGLARRRLSGVAAVLLTLTVTLLALNPVCVGEPPINSSCMAYNRYGYAMLALLLAEAITAVESPTRNGELRGGFSTGVIVAILLFLKVSYFMAAVFLIGACIPCRKQDRARWSGLFAGFSGVFLLFTAYLRFNLGAMWNDLRMASQAKPMHVNWWIAQNLLLPAAFFVVFAALAIAYFRVRRDWTAARTTGLAGAAVLLSGVFLLATNFQFFDLPLDGLLAILVLQPIRVRPAIAPAALRKTGGLLVLGMLMVLNLAGGDAMGLGISVYQARQWEDTPHSAFDAAALTGFRSYQRAYVDMVNDGLELIRRHLQAGDTIMSLDFSNPYSYALGTLPAPGGATTLHYGVNFSAAHRPPAEKLFGEAALVMIPKHPSETHLDAGIALYRPYLDAHFDLVDESAGWWLYRRR